MSKQLSMVIFLVKPKTSSKRQGCSNISNKWLKTIARINKEKWQMELGPMMMLTCMARLPKMVLEEEIRMTKHQTISEKEK